MVVSLITEKKIYKILRQYYTTTGDDVLIIHSQRFLNTISSSNAKDFIVFNLTKGKEDKMKIIFCTIFSTKRNIDNLSSTSFRLCYAH